jgi:hypothetical protein
LPVFGGVGTWYAFGLEFGFANYRPDRSGLS